MARHTPDAGSYAPVTVLVQEEVPTEQSANGNSMLTTSQTSREK